MNWEKLKPLKFANNEIHIGSGTASSACEIAPLEITITAGMGEAYILRDGERIYEHDCCNDEEEVKFLSEFEEMAKLDPDRDWRFVHTTPLHGETFQRQDGLWVCVESNMGFA